MTPYIMHNANDFGNALSHNIIYRTENERKNATIQKSDVRIIFLSCFKLTSSLDYACFLQMICDQISCCSRNSFYVHFMRIAIEWELWLLLLGNLKTYCDSMWKTHPILLWWYITDFHKKNSIDSKSIRQNSRTWANPHQFLCEINDESESVQTHASKPYQNDVNCKWISSVHALFPTLSFLFATRRLHFVTNQ